MRGVYLKQCAQTNIEFEFAIFLLYYVWIFHEYLVKWCVHKGQKFYFRVFRENFILLYLELRVTGAYGSEKPINTLFHFATVFLNSFPNLLLCRYSKPSEVPYSTNKKLVEHFFGNHSTIMTGSSNHNTAPFANLVWICSKNLEMYIRPNVHVLFFKHLLPTILHAFTATVFNFQN